MKQQATPLESITSRDVADESDKVAPERVTIYSPKNISSAFDEVSPFFFRWQHHQERYRLFLIIKTRLQHQ